MQFTGWDGPLVFRATVLADEQQAGRPQSLRTAPLAYAGARPERVPGDPRLAEAAQALLCLHLLLRSRRLYDSSHPQILDHLDSAYDSLKRVASALGGLEVRIERGGVVVPTLAEGHIPDSHGEFYALASDLQRAGVQTVYFAEKFHVGELDTFSQLLKDTLLRSDEPAKRSGRIWWPAKLREQRVEGIQVNTLTDRKVDTVLASLIAALVAYGGNAPQEDGDTAILAPPGNVRRGRAEMGE